VLVSSRSHGLGASARRFALLPYLIAWLVILPLMLTGLFGDPPDAFGLASRRFIHDAAFLSCSRVLLGTTRAVFPKNVRSRANTSSSDQDDSSATETEKSHPSHRSTSGQ
jgi:hypothetical protein